VDARDRRQRACLRYRYFGALLHGDPQAAQGRATARDVWAQLTTRGD
jgi:hypothetical protein